jgi:hypothetical protein
MKSVERSQRSCVHKVQLWVMYKKNQQSPITRVKFVESKWQYNMIKYIWYQTIPQNLNEIRWAVSEELHPQSCDGRTHACISVPLPKLGEGGEGEIGLTCVTIILHNSIMHQSIVTIAPKTRHISLNITGTPPDQGGSGSSWLMHKHQM